MRAATLPTLLLILGGAASAGCAYRTPAVHVPEPMAAVAPAALQIVDVGVTGDESGTESTNVRYEAAEMLAGAVSPPGVAGLAGHPARVRLRVRLGPADRATPTALMGFVFVWPLGLDIEQRSVSVALTVQVGDRTFTGQGAALKWGSVYIPARRRALAAALDQALADAAAAGPRGPARRE